MDPTKRKVGLLRFFMMKEGYRGTIVPKLERLVWEQCGEGLNHAAFLGIEQRLIRHMYEGARRPMQTVRGRA